MWRPIYHATEDILAWHMEMSDVGINTRKVCMRSLWRRFRVSGCIRKMLVVIGFNICNSMHTRSHTHSVAERTLRQVHIYVVKFGIYLPLSLTEKCLSESPWYISSWTQAVTAFPHQLPPHNVTWKVQNRFCQCKAHNLFDIRRIDWSEYTILVSLNYDPWRHDGNSSGNKTKT